jgi:hypothetical protein
VDKLSYLKVCPVCTNEFVTGKENRRACSPSCSKVLKAAPWWFYDDEYERGRVSLAQSILMHPDRHKPSKVAWAKRLLRTYLQSGHPTPPVTRYLRKDSKARQVMVETLGEERTNEIVLEAFRKTVRDP